MKLHKVWLIQHITLIVDEATQGLAQHITLIVDEATQGLTDPRYNTDCKVKLHKVWPNI